MTARARSAVLVAGTVVLLAACDPAPVPDDREDADLTVEVEPTGTARAELFLAPELEDVLRPTAQRLAAAMFGTESATVGIDDNDGGFDFAVITVPDAYEPGGEPHVAISIDNEAARALTDVGIDTLDVNFCAPYVPYDIASSSVPESNEAHCGFWRIDLTSGTLDATMTMRPDTARWYRSVGLALAALASAVTALVCYLRLRRLSSRRRVGIVVAALPGAAAFAVGVATLAAAPHGDNLGVAGDLDGFALTLATWGPATLLPLGVACVVIGILALTSQCSRPSRGVPQAD